VWTIARMGFGRRKIRLIARNIEAPRFRMVILLPSRESGCSVNPEKGMGGYPVKRQRKDLWPSHALLGANHSTVRGVDDNLLLAITHETPE